MLAIDPKIWTSPTGSREDLKDADANAEKAHRKAIKANIKASDAAEIFEWLNPGPASESE